MKNSKTLLDNLIFPECPRWHEGNLWFSDMHGGSVFCVGLQGEILETIEIPGEPGGLGWLPNGELLIVSMQEKCVYRWSGRKLHRHACLAAIHTRQSNDMVVDKLGNAYIGNIGFDIHGGERPQLSALARVDYQGNVAQATDSLMCPNGMVILDEGKTLVVAETFARQLTAYTIAGDGTLTGRRVWADLGKIVPDGICADDEGCIWVSACIHHACVRVRQGGEILDRIDTGRDNPFACVLGGEDGKRLFICVAANSDPSETHRLKSGRIDYIDVPVGRYIS